MTSRDPLLDYADVIRTAEKRYSSGTPASNEKWLAILGLAAEVVVLRDVERKATEHMRRLLDMVYELQERVAELEQELALACTRCGGWPESGVS